MATEQVILILNDNLIEIIGLKDASDDSFQNSATVAANIFDKDGTLIVGPITLAYIAASNGDYRGTIEDSETFILGALYTAKIDADAGLDLKAHWELPLRAENRKFS